MNATLLTRGGAIALMLFAIGCDSPNTFAPPPPPAVTVAPPSVRDVTVYQGFPGRLEAVDFVELRARVRGYLRSIEFEEGSRVEKGRKLFTIESEPFEAVVSSAEAALVRAKAELELAEASLMRMEKAFETKAVSEIEVLVARAKRDVAVADVKAAEAALVRAKLDLSYTTIEAPITGRISKYFVSVGNLVGGTEATLLATLVVEKPIRATFTLDERTILPFLQRGPRPDRPGANVPPVSLELADGSRHPETGRIDYVDNRVDPDTGTLTARAEFPNENGGLAAGLFARVLIPDERKDALLVPDLAIQRDLAGSYLLVVDDRNTVQSRYVKPGPRVGAERIIDEGLAAGERVIVAGLQRARPGIEVRAETKPAPADDATAPRAEAEGASEQE